LFYSPPAQRAALAQLVEHRIRNAGVRCSSHLCGTTTLSAKVRARLKNPTKSATLDAKWPLASALLRLHFGEFGGLRGGPLQIAKMKGPQMALTDIALRNARPMVKPYKLTDEKGPLSSRHPFGWTIMEAEIQK
jgi:hypothetical protein